MGILEFFGDVVRKLEDRGAMRGDTERGGPGVLGSAVYHYLT